MSRKVLSTLTVFDVKKNLYQTLDFGQVVWNKSELQESRKKYNIIHWILIVIGNSTTNTKTTYNILDNDEKHI